MRLLVIGEHGQLAQCLRERVDAFPSIDLILAGRPKLDLERPNQLRSAIRAHAPDALLNAAAYTAVDQAEEEPERAFACNGEGPGLLAEVAADLGIPMIHISTDYVFAGDRAGAYREEDATGPTGVYGESKLAGEKRVCSAYPAATVVRTSWVVSPFGKNFVKTMLALALTRDEVGVVCDQIGTPTSAFDLADGLLNIVSAWAEGNTTGHGEIYHLAGTGHASWSEVAEAIFEEAREVGLPYAHVRPIATADYPTRAVRPRNSTLDCSKFLKAFSFTMPEWRSSINEIVSRCASSYPMIL